MSQGELFEFELQFELQFQSAKSYLFVFMFKMITLMFSCSLQNSGAKYFGNKMLRQIQNFSACLGNALAKKLPKN